MVRLLHCYRTKGLAHGLEILVVLGLLTAACQPAPISLRPPNKHELEAYCQAHGMRLIVDKLVEDSSVVLYDKGTSFGYSLLTVREPDGNVTVSQDVSAAKSEGPILIIGQLTGDHPFMAVVIQDAALLAETRAVEAVIDSQIRLGATTDGRAGVILVSPSPVHMWQTIALYNAQGRVLYSQDNSPQ